MENVCICRDKRPHAQVEDSIEELAMKKLLNPLVKVSRGAIIETGPIICLHTSLFVWSPAELLKRMRTISLLHHIFRKYTSGLLRYI